MIGFVFFQLSPDWQKIANVLPLMGDMCVFCWHFDFDTTSDWCI